MNTKTCTICNNENHINNFYKKYSECIDCNRARGLQRFYGKKIKYQTNDKYIMKKIEKKYYYRNKTIEVYNLEI